MFTQVEAKIVGVPEGEARRMYTQRLFNRLLFLYFIQKKGWLEFNGSKNYLRELYKAAEANKESYLNDRLYWAFFHGLNTVVETDPTNVPDDILVRRGKVPFLNGGLFDLEDKYDIHDAVTISNSAFNSILNLFESYNFTVAESTPLDVEVAVDPEMLGKVFEELVTGRHESGSYYTPRPIVAFMARESLKHYLLKTGNSAEAIARFVDGNDASELIHPEAVLTALQSVTVCDPACGSGAYLLGMMHELLRLREALYAKHKKDDADIYHRKLAIIQKNLHGVDKDGFAVNIAKLRLWLSLVVDYNKPGEPLPLPNLDYKIECGDSLLSPAPMEQLNLQGEYFAKKSDAIAKLKAEHFKQSGAEKQATKVKINALQAELTDDNRVPAEKIIDWRVAFCEVFAAGGFDIVVGNPPYVSAVTHAATEKVMRSKLRIQYPKLKGSFDIYAAFLLRGCQLIKSKGAFAWIVPNKVLVADYARNTIAHLKTKGLATSIDVSSHGVFDTTGVYPLILLSSGNKSEFSEYRVTSIADLDTHNYVLKCTLRDFSTLSDFGIKIGSGATGFQASEILGHITEQKLFGSIPFVVSGCVDRYSISYDDVRYMKHKFSKAYITKYNGLASSKWNFWFGKKIVIAGMTKCIESVYCPHPLALGVGIYAIYDFGGFDPDFLVGILNSRFVSYYLNVKFEDKHLAGGYLAINKSTIEKLPMIKATKDEQVFIADLSRQIVQAKAVNATDSRIAGWEAEINDRVAALFKLTPAEVKLLAEV